MIANLVECHPYYVQQLAQIAWLRSSRTCSEEIILQSLESLMLQLSMLFQAMTDNLTKSQVDFLRAILEGVEQFSSKETLTQYNMGTSANVLKIKQALFNKEITDKEGEKLVFLDPLYKHWLEKKYFKTNPPPPVYKNKKTPRAPTTCRPALCLYRTVPVHSFVSISSVRTFTAFSVGMMRLSCSREYTLVNSAPNRKMTEA